MIDLIRLANDCIESYRARHGVAPECLVMNEATMLMLAEQSTNMVKTAAIIPEMQGRPFVFMGYRIRLSPTIAGIHAAS
jgi:hypothetical protein